MINPWFYLLAVNVVTYGMYWQDKRASRRGGWRVSEAMLLMCGLLGGTLAAILAQQTLRHKTKKRSFQLKFWTVTAVQIILLLLPPAALKLILTRLFA